MTRRWTGDNGTDHAGRLRAQRLIKNMEKCEFCGSKKLLVRHHIDMNPLNNKLDNLIIICLPCHTHIHNGTPKNKEIALKRLDLVISARTHLRLCTFLVQNGFKKVQNPPKKVQNYHPVEALILNLNLN